MNEGDSEDKKLKWRFDISTFRLIGRELITDRITQDLKTVQNSVFRYDLQRFRY